MTYKSKGLSKWVKQFLACERKKLYLSKKVADRRAKKNTQKYGEKMISYKCPCCAGYHLARK